MPPELDDTLCALATPPGASGIGIIRLSGPRAFAITDRATRPKRPMPCAKRRGHTLHRATVIDAGGDPIDDCLVAVYHAPRSYTGEDVTEIMTHGGPVPLRQTLARCLELGARLAHPGEYTQRAFLNGKMNLAEAEAVADTIAARTDQSLALARRQSHLTSKLTDLRDQILSVLARTEASIDFPEDVGDLDIPAAAHDLTTALDNIDLLLSTADRGIIMREGATLVLIGRPNVGKSSLLNALLRTARAIVTPIPGTTRDTLEETLNLSGIPLRAIDTAGLRDTADPIERLGIDRTNTALQTADFIILVLDATAPDPADNVLRAQIAHRPHLVVLNKYDLVTAPPAPNTGRARVSYPNLVPPVLGARGPLDPIPISAATGWNLDALETALADALLQSPAPSTDTPTVTHARHKHALQSARDSLKAALNTLENGLPPDLLAIDLNDALTALGLITGETTPDDILAEIFSRFCIGK